MSFPWRLRPQRLKHRAESLPKNGLATAARATKAAWKNEGVGVGETQPRAQCSRMQSRSRPSRPPPQGSVSRQERNLRGEVRLERRRLHRGTRACAHGLGGTAARLRPARLRGAGHHCRNIKQRADETRCWPAPSACDCAGSGVFRPGDAARPTDDAAERSSSGARSVCAVGHGHARRAPRCPSRTT